MIVCWDKANYLLEKAAGNSLFSFLMNFYRNRLFLYLMKNVLFENSLSKKKLHVDLTVNYLLSLFVLVAINYKKILSFVVID